MQRAFSCAAAFLGLLLLGPFVEAQKPAAKDAEKNTEKTIKAGQLVGVVKAIYEDKRTLRLDIQVPTLNASAVNSYAQAQVRYQQALARGDANGARQALVQMAQQKANLYRYETKPLEVHASEEVVVRAMRPPEQFDDKGKIKRYTAKELRELKGESRLPGYKSEFGDIHVDSVVQVSLVQRRDALRLVGKPKKDPELAGENLPMASQILILRDAPPGK